MCLSFYKLSADSYAESKQCVPNDTNITSTGHSCNPTHRPTHRTRISYRLYPNLTGCL